MTALARALALAVLLWCALSLHHIAGAVERQAGTLDTLVQAEMRSMYEAATTAHPILKRRFNISIGGLEVGDPGLHIVVDLLVHNLVDGGKVAPRTSVQGRGRSLDQVLTQN